MDYSNLTKEELKQLCKEWQEILRLQNWDIEADICRSDEFNVPNRTGENCWDLSIGKAYIRVLHPVDYKKSVWPHDMELVLVHELLHLYFIVFSPEEENTIKHSFMENTIETLAKVLVRLRREGRVKYETEKY